MKVDLPDDISCICAVKKEAYIWINSSWWEEEQGKYNS